MVSEVVCKLMKKSPEERYQTAAGLKADLDRLLKEMLTSDADASEYFESFSMFSLGEFDGASLFSLPDDLYGRDNEIKLLREAFKKTCEMSTPSLFLVTGFSGIGKTRFVNEIAQDVTALRATFVTGKCDQIRNRPLSCFLQGFQSLIKRQLAASEEEIETLKNSISRGVKHLALLIQVMPELKAIVDEKSISSIVESSLDSSLCLQEAFVDFVSVLTEDRPLCMFIDDLQWGDYPTFQLMQSFVKSPKTKRFFLIGAYRENELESNAFLKAAIDKLKSDVPERVVEVGLNNFDFGTTERYIKSCFNGSFEETLWSRLAVLIFEKTRGNPYHLGKLLVRLYQDNIIFTSSPSSQKGFRWNANIEALEGLGELSENILQLVMHDLAHLDSSTKTLLQYASGIGNVFSFALLRQSLSHWKTKDIIVSLNLSINAGIIRPLTTWSAKLTPEIDDDFLANLIETENPQYRWSHDRVQQAVYESISPENAAAVEWAIGEAWQQQIEDKNDDVQPIFESAEHFIRSLKDMKFRNVLVDDKVKLAGIALIHAGIRAYTGGAMDSVLKYLRLAFQVLGESGWNEGSEIHNQVLEAHYCAQRAAVYMKDSGFRTEIFNDIVAHVNSPLLKAKAYFIESDGLEMDFKPECVERCHQTLELLGYYLPRASKFTVIKGSLLCRRLVRHPDFFKVLTLPEEKDERNNLISSCLNVLGLYYYKTKIENAISPWMEIVKFQLNQGAISGRIMASISFCGVSLLRSGWNVKTAEKFGQILLALAERYSNVIQRCDALYGAYCYAMYTQSLESISSFGCTSALAVIGGAWADAQIHMGRPLYLIKNEWSKLLALRSAITLPDLRLRISLAMQIIDCLAGNAEIDFEAKGEWYAEEEDSPLVKAATRGYIGRMVIWGLLHGVLAFWSRDWYRCHEFMSRARNDYRNNNLVLISYKMWPFYDAISSFGILHVIKTKGRWLFHTSSKCLAHLKPTKEYKEIVRRGLKLLKRMAKWTPETEAHRYQLLLAERERLKLTYSTRRKTVSLYLEAARLALQNGFPNEAGLAKELCAQYLQTLGEPHQEYLGYLKDALKHYDEWGSPPLVQQLLSLYPNLKEENRTPSSTGLSNTQTTQSSKFARTSESYVSGKVITSEDYDTKFARRSRTADSTSPIQTVDNDAEEIKGFKLLDFISVLKASQNISSQQTLENTLKATLEAILENSGASRAALFQYSSTKMLMLCEASVVDAKSADVAGEATSEGSSHRMLGRRDILRNNNGPSKLGITISTRFPSASIPGPLSLLNYVARTNLTVILNDASTSEFAEDPYFISKCMKSILCTPLTGYSGVDLQLMVYMEHPTVGVFTGDRVEVSKILLQQAAFDIDKTQTADAVARFVPSELLSLLGINSVKNAALGDAVEKVMTIFFADIRGFTTLSEKMTPSECFKFVNQLLGALVPELTGNGLVVDKFIGDAIMALSADSDSQIGAENAVRAGIDMQQRLSIFNRTQSKTIIRLGIGIHTGSTMLGLLGSSERVNVTVISDSVNSASRVESITKRYGATMIISDSTYKLLPNPDAFSIRILDDIIVKGQSKPLRIYEVIDAEPDEVVQKRKIKLKEIYERGLEKYRDGNITGAYEIFQQVLDMYADDVPTKLFLERCEYWLQQGIPEEWSPIWVMKEK
ncbi:hypothetical protein HDU76_000540 [Blyttiomyces sp. JEL0837]|nr:hypothetical protein HDU76_000540 [Blyttiomyces sp. JEL0837]